MNSQTHDRVPTIIVTAWYQIKSHSPPLKLFCWLLFIPHKIVNKDKSDRNKIESFHLFLFFWVILLSHDVCHKIHIVNRTFFLLFSRQKLVQIRACVFSLSFLFFFRWGCLQYIRHWHGLSWMGIGHALCGKTEIKSVFIGIDAVPKPNHWNECHKFP